MFTINFLIYLAIVLPIWAVYRIFVLNKNKKMNSVREIMINMFLIYLLGVVYLTFFSKGIRPYNWHPSVNVIPIKETISMIKKCPWSVSFVNLAGNILLLLPVGIFVPTLFKKTRSMKKVISTGFLISLSIEITQLLTGLRICDIDDLILNTIGTMMGYIFYVLIRKVSKRFISLENKVEEDTQGSLFIIAVRPAIVAVMLILCLCAASIYQSNYSFLLNNSPNIYSYIAQYMKGLF
jgi:Glycopeptide antibiotics resistance protein